MNLPTRITFTNKRSIKYQYDAAGIKLRKIVDDGNHKIETYYMGGYQYQSDGEVKLQFFPTSEGYVKALYKEGEPDEPMAYAYVYNYTDHLGNIRLSYAYDKDTNEVKTLEENHYYPFGLKHGFYNEELYEIALKQQAQNEKEVKQTVKKGYNYKFQGQEYQEELNLNLYDYQWRDYDAAIARFNNIDRFAEKYHSLTPYHFTANNPMFYREIAGDSLTESAETKANELITHAKKGKDEANDDIANYEAKKKETTRKGRIRRLNERIKLANDRIDEFDQTIEELNELKDSTQWYDYKEMDAYIDDDSGLFVYGVTEFDTDTGMVIIRADSKLGGKGKVAHEFKHAFQFEIGDMAFDAKTGKGSRFLWDIYNEREANDRARLFGNPTDSIESGESLRWKIKNINQAERRDKRNIYIFRYDGKTYK